MEADSICEPRNISRVLCLLCVGWLGEVNLRKSVAVISITDLHVTVTWCISLTINIYYSPQIWQSPSLFCERGLLVRLYADRLELGIWFTTSCHSFVLPFVEFGSSCFNHVLIKSWFVWLSLISYNSYIKIIVKYIIIFVFMFAILFKCILI